MAKRILEIQNLSVSIPAEYGKDAVPILRGINLHLDEQECVGIIGGSGAGKSVLMSAMIHSLREPLTVTEGAEFLEGQDLFLMAPSMIRKSVLGKKIASICPNPHWRLDPINCIGDQIRNIYLSHFPIKPDQAKRRVIELLQLVGIPDPEKRYNAFPSELSGGMAQRVLVTIALICEPTLLLADEPTGGLDVTIQIQVFNLIRRLIREQKRSTIVASRDIALIYHLCDRVYVLHEGRIVESGTVSQVIHNPQHPYTARLVKLSESNHQTRKATEYQAYLSSTQTHYERLLAEHARGSMNGYVDVGEGHQVGVNA